jgi:hypothetical protein
MPAIEFSNNGIFDSLTGAPAPKLFFDNVAREISQSRRNSQSISIMTIKLLPEVKDVKRVKKPSIKNTQQKNLEFEKLLAQVSNNIKINMRGSDFYSRIAENGFWLCLQGDLDQAVSAAQRFEKVISEKLIDSSGKAHLEFSSNEWKSNLDLNNWISEVDRQYFTV